MGWILQVDILRQISADAGWADLCIRPSLFAMVPDMHIHVGQPPSSF